MIERGEKVADGSRPLKKDRFVLIDTTGKGSTGGLVWPTDAIPRTADPHSERTRARPTNRA